MSEAATTAFKLTEALGSMGSASSPSFSPDGTRIAYVTNLSGSPQVWISPVDGGKPVQVTNLPDPVQSVYWSPAGNWLAYDVAPGGGLNVQIYAVPPEGGTAKLLTAGGEVNNRLSGWSRDGNWVTFGSNSVHPDHLDAFLANPNTGETKALGKQEGLTLVNDMSRDGKWAVVTRQASRGDNNVLLVNVASGTETLLTPHDQPSQFGSASFSPDGRKIYLTANDVTDLTVFGEITVDANGKPGPIRIIASRPDAEADEFVVEDSGRRAALLWNVAGRSECAFMELATEKVWQGPELPDVVNGLTFSADGKWLAFTAHPATAPSDIWVMDLSNGKLSQVSHSSHKGVDLSRLIRPTLVKYKAHDGLELSGWLYRPEGAKGPGPVVFSYHGGPEGQSRPYLDTDTQALLARGITVFVPNVRGSSGFGKRFLNLDNGALRKNGVKDIEAGTNALIEMGIADPKRLGIMGGSYGGYMVMAGVTEFPDMFAGGANLFGVVNFDTFFKHTQPWMAAISTIKYGNPVTEAEMLKELSPINKLDRIKTPLIVLHGANDTNVPVIEAEQIVEQLTARGITVEYVLYPDEGHGWRQLHNRIDSAVKIANFFDKHLLY